MITKPASLRASLRAFVRAFLRTFVRAFLRTFVRAFLRTSLRTFPRAFALVPVALAALVVPMALATASAQLPEPRYQVTPNGLVVPQGTTGAARGTGATQPGAAGVQGAPQGKIQGAQPQGQIQGAQSQGQLPGGRVRSDFEDQRPSGQGQGLGPVPVRQAGGQKDAGSAAAASPVSHSPVSPSPASPSPAPPGGSGAPNWQHASPVSGARAPTRGALDLSSPLLDVFQRVGHPSDLQALAGVVVSARIQVFDAHGTAIGVRDLVHEADLQSKLRDRLVFPSMRKTYGRDGPSVWVLFHGMQWPALENEARDELDLFGLMLRAPWVFADTQRFHVAPAEVFVQDERRAVRIRIEERTSGDELIGPLETRPKTDSYEVCCAQDSMEPHELRIRRANGSLRIVKLLDWRDVGSVRMPMRRVFLAPDGARALEIVTTMLDIRQNLGDARFVPAAR